MAILPQIRYPKKKGETFLPEGRSGQILAYKTPKIATDNKISSQRKAFSKKPSIAVPG